MKIDRFVSRCRLALLLLAAVLICLAITPPPLTACSTCKEGSVRTVYTSIVCCNDPRLPSRPGERQICQNCQWVVQSTGCFRASVCAF